MTVQHEVRVEDVEFYRHGERPLLARLYRPDGEGPFPGVVEVHGGAWTLNDRTTNEPIARPLAALTLAPSAPETGRPPRWRPARWA